jgi:hypothetical protein
MPFSTYASLVEWLCHTQNSFFFLVKQWRES